MGPGPRPTKRFAGAPPRAALAHHSPLARRRTDERPYELRCADRTHAWIYDFGLRLPASAG
ncbi:hypothetical protein ABT084_26085, partial [Streptomyces sp. NPDC002138]|uniref:hypothetical protein n=1 Tax=Streptomyces sp. NPDC002138 TaxID=3154410 RepID=UPI003331BF29